MNETPMKIQEMHFAYRPGRPVIEGIGAEVHAGEVHALIGPNGCGKTTLMRLMLGALVPTYGRVLLDDRPVAKTPAAQRASVLSYVPQRSTASFAFSVRQVVAMGRFALSRDEAAIDAAMHACDLDDLKDEAYAELSVGQQQRVLLARAMAQAAGGGRIMLADEPTSAMDLSHAHRTMTMLLDRAKRGMAIVAVVQDLNLAARYADRVWLMDRGKLVRAGAWRDVLRADVLEKVYGVKIRAMNDAETSGGSGGERPVFDVRLPLASVRG
ncbi:MAG: ATP-binding cassette domain-containing protein [Planctomycetes bacterium]|nr:ATP-binding cassette domain-containing protein [Planctomycetota bacterium]